MPPRSPSWRATPAPDRVEAVVFHHLPVFHTEHCVFCRFLSTGTSYRDCGRPCEKHHVALRDAAGREHPVMADVGCRNTVFGAEAQQAASTWTIGASPASAISGWSSRTNRRSSDAIARAFEDALTGRHRAATSRTLAAHRAARGNRGQPVRAGRLPGSPCAAVGRPFRAVMPGFRPACGGRSPPLRRRKRRPTTVAGSPQTTC